MTMSVSGIVASGKPQVVTWMENQDKKRVEQLQEKSKEGTISKLEKAELYSREVANALKNYAPRTINFNGVQKANATCVKKQTLTWQDIENLAARQKKGLNPKIATEIMKLPEKQRQLFYLKDEKGNYMVPTKVLNGLIDNEKFKIEHSVSDMEGCANHVKIITYDEFNMPKDTYQIGVYWENGPLQHVVIKKVDSSAYLETNLHGEYENKTDNIIDDTIEQGKTKNLN